MKYLFYLAKSYSVSIVEPLVKYLDETHRDYAFYVSAKIKRTFPQDWDQKLILHTIKQTKTFKPDYALAPGNFIDFRIPGIKVQVFHGLGVEKPIHYAIRHFFDVFLTSGKYVTDRYLALQKKYRYFEVIETGWLKIDRILNYPIADLKARFNVPEGKKLILYAPTFCANMESGSDLIPLLSQIAREDEYWFLKFHEFMPKEMIDCCTKLDPFRFRVITREDITPYLHLSNIMISDTSSVVYEFMTLDKPVITYKAICREDKAYNIAQPEFLRDAIDTCITYPDFLKQRRDKAIGEVNPYLDGKTAERIVMALERLNPEDYPKKSKPLNLIRKIQVVYHSIFKRGYLR